MPGMTEYLTQSYQREVLKQPVEVQMPEITPEAIEEAKAALKRIDSMKLGANLVNRDFVAYQDRRAILAFLAEAEKQQAG